MLSLETLTIAVRLDEPALSLWEGNLITPPDKNGNTAWHRYQIIRVIRNDRPANCKVDLGAREKYTANGFYIPGGVIRLRNGHETFIPEVIPYESISRIESLHTVAELRHEADDLRNPRWTSWEEIVDMAEPRLTIGLDKTTSQNILERFFEEQESKQNWAKGRRIFT